jgi:hypothetical protein
MSPPSPLRELFPSLFLVHARTGNAGFSYLIKRKQGNILIPAYNKELIDARLDDIEKLGGVSAIYINGKHNAKMPNFPSALTEKYHPPIHISDIDAKTYHAPSKLPNVQPIPFRRQRLADDLEAVPFPGYSKGGMAYLWQSKGKKYLFAGITITRINNEWRTWVASTVTGKAFINALKELQSTKADVLLLNSFSNTEDPWFTFTPVEWDQLFEDLIANPKPGKSQEPAQKTGPKQKQRTTDNSRRTM